MSPDKQKEFLFDSYIQIMFRRRQQQYSQIEMERWLSWLARSLVQRSQTIFLIELIQPSYLQTKFQKKIYAIGVASISGLCFGIITGLTSQLSYGVVIGLVISLVVLLSRNIINSSIEYCSTTAPNQVIWKLAKKTIIATLVSSSIFGLIGQLFGFPVIAVLGLIVGMRVGGLTCIQHFVLRIILYRSGYIPWNYARFLDYVADRLLLQKVGGGYIFIHHLVMERFASMQSHQ